MKTVGNKIIASEGYILQRKSDQWIAGKFLTLGYTYHMYGHKLDEPFLELPEHYQEIVEPPPVDENGTPIIVKIVPIKITKMQLKLALLQQGKLVAIEEAIAAMNDPVVNIIWENSTIIERADPLVNSLCASMEMDKDETDDFFIYANTL